MARKSRLVPLWLCTLAACGGEPEPPKVSADLAAAAVPQRVTNPSAKCDSAGAGSSRDDGYTGNEIRSWARPDPPSEAPCPSGSPVTATAVATAGGISDADGTAPTAEREDDTPPEITAPVGDAGPTAPLDSTRVPLVAGLKIVSALHFPEGDRENVVTVREAGSDGATYFWRFEQEGGQGPKKGEFQRFVRASDLAAAPRLNTVYMSVAQRETPGYTSFTISRATYARLLSERETRYTMTALQRGPLGGQLSDLLSSRLALKGTLTLASSEPEPMPILLNGRRVRVPTIRLKGRFALQDQKEENEIWVLADSAHPLLLKIVTGPEVYQTIRIDLPESPVPDLERALQAECRAELPGIYFDFNSAQLDPASAPAIEGVASMLDRNPDWTLSVEGHTDSIGGDQSNQVLSVRRAGAVRAALIERYDVAPDRLQAVGFGARRPREPNNTLEGRARNRRVELVRAC